MLNKRGDMIFADMFSIFFTVLLLVGFVIYFLAPGVSETKQEEIIIKESIYGNENIFVLNAFLNTPVAEGKISDLVNLWLLEDSYEARLIEESSGIFYNVYGKCYELKIGDSLSFGDYTSSSHFANCIEYPNFGKEPIKICLDISGYDEKFKEGKEAECF